MKLQERDKEDGMTSLTMDIDYRHAMPEIKTMDERKSLHNAGGMDGERGIKKETGHDERAPPLGELA